MIAMSSLYLHAQVDRSVKKATKKCPVNINDLHLICCDFSILLCKPKIHNLNIFPCYSENE